MTIQANQGFGVSVFGAVSGGGGTPGGLNTQVQFNSSGSFGASANLTFVSPALTIGTQQTTQGQIVFANTAAGAFATTVQSSNSASAAWTLTLPATAGTANYALTTNGSGVSSWSQISLTAGVTGILPLANGGTNANLTASNGGIVYSGASAFAVLSGTATAGQMLRSGASGAPSWSTATFPSTATSAGTILRADGTNWVATTATYPTTTTANQLLYSSATNTVGGLTSANTSALVTNASGVPSFTSGTTANRVLRTDGTTVSFAQVGLTTDVTGVLPVANGGTNASSASITAFNNITGYTASGATGTTSTNLVFSTSPNITTPTFTTSATGPLFIGGSGTTSTLTLRSTSNVGTTGADIVFQVGNNGATEGLRITNDGNVGINTTTTNPVGTSRNFAVVGSSSASFSLSSSTALGCYFSTDASTYGQLVAQGSVDLLFVTSGVSQRMRITSGGNVAIGSTVSPTTLLSVAGPISLASPSTKTGDYSLTATDSSLIFNGSGTITLTLQNAANYTGRILYVKTIAAQAVNSASSNVVPRNSATAGTAILTATAGNWAMLQSDGTNWVIMCGS